MTWEDDNPDGTCHTCGADLSEDGDHQDFHTLCWACWRAENGTEEPAWRKPRPEPGTQPASFVEGLAKTRAELQTLTRIVLSLQQRLETLERRRAA